MRLAAFIDLASFEDRRYGMEEDPLRPGAVDRAAEKVANVMGQCGADGLYLDSPCGCEFNRATGKWDLYAYRQILGDDFKQWRTGFVRAFRPVFAQWETIVYTGGFWGGLDDLPAWERIEIVSRVEGLFAEAGAKWRGHDTAGTITAPSWETDLLNLAESLGPGPLVEGPALKGCEHLLRFGAIQTSEQYGAKLAGGVPEIHPIAAHRADRPRVVLFNGSNIDTDWSDDPEVDGWKFSKWLVGEGLVPALGPFGRRGIVDLRKLMPKEGVSGLSGP